MGSNSGRVLTLMLICLLACNINSKDKIKAMISMAINFAKEGLDVGIVVDGPVRDDSKRVSTK
jgi:hypothetical protein